VQLMYSTVCNAIIRPGVKLVHPDTGERYGGTDWTSADKRAELGVVPLRTELQSVDSIVTEWEIVDDPTNTGGKLRRPLTTAPLPAPDATGIQKVQSLIKEECARRIEQLAVPFGPFTFRASDVAANELGHVVIAIMSGAFTQSPIGIRDSSGIVRGLTFVQCRELHGIVVTARRAIREMARKLRDVNVPTLTPLEFTQLDVGAAQHWEAK